MTSSSTTSAPLLVTGAAGFIGSAFVRSCQARGIPVISVDRPSHFVDRTEHRGTHFGQIVDREGLFEWLKNESPRLSGIVHMGACSRTTETDEAFLKRNNVEYSQKLWMHATREKLPFVYASSAATYGDGSSGYDDNESVIERLQPLNLYGMSKQIFDLWALDQEKKGFQPTSWAGFKFFNVYGLGERHKLGQASVVLHAFDQIKSTGGTKLFKSHKDGIADGHQKRDFVFVDDVVAVLHFALEKRLARGIFNLGSGQARSFLDLARAVFLSLGQPEKIQFVETPLNIRDKYQYFTQAAMSRLRGQGYPQPFTSLEEGVKKYVEQLSAKATR
jgi:ADP-L-glycero-D-manno-heptose 6-epimerase